jgi:Secretion system C-terminal sorting domain
LSFKNSFSLAQPNQLGWAFSISMKYALTIFILSVQMGLQAQTYFSKVFGRPFPYLSPITGAVSVGDTSYLLTSYPYDYTKDTSKLRTILIDAKGKEKWTKDYGANNSQFECQKIMKYRGDTLIICGYYRVKPDTVYYGMLFLINTNGDSIALVQQKYYNSRSTYITDFIIQNENIISTGFLEKLNTPATGYRRQLFVTNTTRHGDLIWQFNLNTSGLDMVGSSICTTPDSGFIISGRRVFPYALEFRTEGLILKINKFGQQEWVRYTGEFEYNYAYTTIKPSGDGNYYLCGTWGNNKLAFPNTWYETGTLIAKIDELGNIIWQRRYWKEIAEATLNDMVVLPNGDFVACGNDDIAFAWGEKEISSLAKFSSNGDIIWSRQFNYNPAHNERLYSIIQTPDNGFLMVGDAHEIDTLGLGAASDGWVLKVDSAGCEIMNCVSSDTEPEIEEESFMAYPNPVSSLLQIQFEQNATGLLRIFNANGQEMFRAALGNEPEIQVNMSTYPNGVYWFNIQTSDQVLTKKIVKVE